MKLKRLFGFLALLLCAALCFTFAACDPNKGDQKTLEKITLNTEAVQKSFTVGDTFTHEGLVVTAHYSDETSEVVTTGYTVIGYNMSAEGAQTVTVTYEGKTATYQITVNPPHVEHEHTYGEPVWKWTASDTEGYTVTATFTCVDNDDEQVETATVTSKTTDASCEDDGKTEYTAKVTFEEVDYTDEKVDNIPATGHSYGEPVWSWTGNDDAGYTAAEAKFTCANCQDEQTVEADEIEENEEQNDCVKEKTYSATVSFEDDEYSDVKTVVMDGHHTFTDGWIEEEPATCEDNGVKAHYHCTVCGNDFDEDGKTELKDISIPATGHSYGAPSWKWVGTGADGYTAATATFTCTNDGCEDKQVEDAVVTEQETPATCEENGKIVYAATVTFQDEEYSAEQEVGLLKRGHSYAAPYEWTWQEAEEGGYTAKATFKCERCDNEKTEEAVVTAETTTVATCEQNGKITYTAKVTSQDTEYTDEKEVTILGEHNYGEWIEQAATCTEGGVLGHYHCDACDKDFDADKVDIAGTELTTEATGHEFEDGACANCDAAVTGAGVIDFDPNIIGVSLNTTNLTTKDLEAVRLVIDGVVVAESKPYQVQSPAAGLRPMFNNIFSLITTVGEHTVEFEFYGKIVAPTNIGAKGDHTNGNLHYTLDTNEEGKIVVNVTAIGEEPDPDEPVVLTLQYMETYGAGYFHFLTQSSVNIKDATSFTVNGVTPADFRYDVDGNNYHIHVQVGDTNLARYEFEWKKDDVTIATAVYTQEVSGGGDGEGEGGEEGGDDPIESREIAITKWEFYADDWAYVHMSEEDYNYLANNATSAKVNEKSSAIVKNGNYWYNLQTWNKTDAVYEISWLNAQGKEVAHSTYTQGGGSGEGGGETEEPVTYTTNGADIALEENKVYFIVSGTFTGTDLDKLQTMLEAIAFDLQANSGVIYGQDDNWERTDNIYPQRARIDIDGNTWKIYYDITDVETYAFHAHFDGGDLKLPLDQAEEGKAVTLNGRKYTLINRNGATTLSEYWGCVGLRITELGAPSFTTEEVDFYEDGGKVYLVIKGTSENYTEEALKAALDNTHFNLQHNPDAGADKSVQWQQTDKISRETFTNEDGTWEVKIDLTNLDKSAYTAHWGGAEKNLTSADRTLDGKYAVANGKSFLVINKNGEEGADADGGRFWGAIGIIVGDENTMKSIGGRLEVQGSKVYFVLEIYIIGYEIERLSMGNIGDDDYYVVNAEIKEEPNGSIYKLYFDITERAADGKILWCHMFVDGSPYTGFWDGNIYAGDSMSVTVGDKVYQLKRDDSTAWILQIIVNLVED